MMRFFQIVGAIVVGGMLLLFSVGLVLRLVHVYGGSRSVEAMPEEAVPEKPQTEAPMEQPRAPVAQAMPECKHAMPAFADGLPRHRRVCLEDEKNPCMCPSWAEVYCREAVATPGYPLTKEQCLGGK